jgi:hypothetical protein
MKRRFILRSKAQSERAAAFLQSLPLDPSMPLEVVIRDHDPARTTDQNAALWAALADISEQVVWHGQKYAPEDWKDIITAGLKTQRFAPGINGGLVALGISTSRLRKKQFGDLLEYVSWFGALKGVKFSAPEEA